MGYHTHFYACDPNKQVDWAKRILKKFQQRLQNKVDNFPNDEFFKRIYDYTMKMVTDEKYQEFHENAKKYAWPQWCIDDNEKFFVEHRDPNYTWETEKKEWGETLEKLKYTGLLDLKFDGDFALDYVAFLVEYWDLFMKHLDDDEEDPDSPCNFEIRDGKIYSGNIFKRFYRVKGRYCESMWFNSNGIIEMIEDYVDVTKTTKTGKHPKLKLTKEEKREIEQFFNDYEDCYCWII